MNLNLRKASAIVKDLQYTIIPSLLSSVENKSTYKISTLVATDISEAVSKGTSEFTSAVELLEKALGVHVVLRQLIQEVNNTSGINLLVSDLKYKQSLLKAYQDISNIRNSHYSIEELQALYDRTRRSNTAGNYSYNDFISCSVEVDFEEKIEQLEKEIKSIKNEKLLGANFHHSIEITEEMKSTLEELKAI